MSERDDRDARMEAILTAHRERDRDGLPVAPPQWWDLSAEDRVLAFHRQAQARAMERALDPRGWSTTVKAVLARLG